MDGLRMAGLIVIRPSSLKLTECDARTALRCPADSCDPAGDLKSWRLVSSGSRSSGASRCP